MSEQLNEFAYINFDGETVAATRENTIIYMHLGRNALYDHVFVTWSEREIGAYIWAQEPPENPNFVALLHAAEENECEMHVNIQSPSERDVEAFGKAAMRSMSFDEVPKEWMQ